ncbi:DUF1844 domain-containing protein [bacterium]|nr:DUF1844 domain-containing protein [bacterium]
MAEEKKEEFVLPNVWDLLKAFVITLSENAWRWMGLVVNPVTGRPERDMEQARVAIDCVDILIQRLEGKLSWEETKSFKEILANLQMNFVQQTLKEGGEKDEQ